ncbi:hypothetical protein I4Q36_06825 [Tuanshanicoccus lijuaniae]|uniref:hypothetical protein n=1 Tax=Aerococcaceae bacterium zg-1292 TaxID=2774330 RepID=UPI0019369DFA|nr:hypothetical protein [Aerococcaceae bacterium zg-1292]MBS4456693.1 hypothetical protein [Aerococcaceae bacterium zg-A91]MBS4458485.1 hypothetical protein [Aerococcaceae bacterium zg-BR33]QQA36525.1 hypothetical protein I4Q36_06825 [Aerococcaceae bacterium zg-1292]
MKGVFKILTQLYDLVFLNIIFVLSCLPLITIPISWTALVLMEMESDGVYGYIVKDYWKQWKRVAKQVLEYILLGILALLLVYLAGHLINVPLLNQAQIILGLLVFNIFLLMPLTIGRLQLKDKEFLYVSVYLGYSFPLKVILLLLINVFCLFLSVSTYLGFYIFLSIFTLIGFVILAKFNAKILTSIEHSIEIDEVS